MSNLTNLADNLKRPNLKPSRQPIRIYFDEDSNPYKAVYKFYYGEDENGNDIQYNASFYDNGIVVVTKPYEVDKYGLVKEGSKPYIVNLAKWTNAGKNITSLSTNTEYIGVPEKSEGGKKIRQSLYELVKSPELNAFIKNKQKKYNSNFSSVNGYYGDSQMMNWFAPPTNIENIGGTDYEFTPYGVPMDEPVWMKERKNYLRNARMSRRRMDIVPTQLPSGDRLEDSFSNVTNENQEDDKILGMSKPMFYIVLGAVVLGGGLLAYKYINAQK